MNESNLRPSSGPLYPLAVGPTGRYLVDQAGTPVLLQGDFGWSLMVSTQRGEVLRYLLDRQGKGFNAIYLGLIDHLFSYDPPRNWYGDDPFTTPGDFSTPNEAYFSYADWVIQKAAEAGICVFVAPSFLGYRAPGGGSEGVGGYSGYHARSEGWYEEVLTNGADGCYEYGRYVGRRYGRFDNIVWVMAGDRCAGDALEHMRAMARGILEEDPRHLITAHVHPGCKPYEQFPDDSWLTLSNTYTYGIVHRDLIEDYNANPRRPSFLLETTFEGEHNASAVQIRRQAYWAILSGACGQFMGNLPTWHFSPGWACGLDSPGSRDMARLGEFFKSMPWWNLVPDQQHLIVVGGLGEFRGLDYCAAAGTPDGSLTVAYMPTPRRITVDLARLTGHRKTAAWFDPASGERHAAGDFPADGFVDLAPPEEHDWVLILDAAGDGSHGNPKAAAVSVHEIEGPEAETGDTALRSGRSRRRLEPRNP